MLFLILPHLFLVYSGFSLSYGITEKNMGLYFVTGRIKCLIENTDSKRRRIVLFILVNVI